MQNHMAKKVFQNSKILHFFGVTSEINHYFNKNKSVENCWRGQIGANTRKNKMEGFVQESWSPAKINVNLKK